MADAQLPREGPVRLGSVSLPAGRLVTANYGTGEPVAWATDDPVPAPGRVWDALMAEHPRTGLVPFLLSGLHGDVGRPWDEGEFEDPVDPGMAGGLDAAAVLADMWERRLPHESSEDEEWARFQAPFSRRFPGLAPAARRAPWQRPSASPPSTSRWPTSQREILGTSATSLPAC